jgi:hypothetical protein
LEETEAYRIVRNAAGVIEKVHKGGGDTIPQFMDHTLKDRKSWEEEFLPRLDIALESRYPENRDDWEDIKARFNSPEWDRPVRHQHRQYLRVAA